MLRHVQRPFLSLVVVMAGAGCSSTSATPAGALTQVVAQPTPTPIPTPSPTPAPTPSPTPQPNPGVEGDESLWNLLTRVDPFSGYRLFPNVEEITSGRLEGSGAHARVRVTMNATAFRVLDNGRLPPGGSFPNGSVIFKEVLSDGIYAVMRKENGGPVSGAGWVWAEFRRDGNVVYSSGRRGGACISCHSLQRGPQNDLVRTFERQ